MVNGSKNVMLVDEFNVQVFAGGKVQWDRFDSYLKKNPLLQRRLLSHLERRNHLSRSRPALPRSSR